MKPERSIAGIVRASLAVASVAMAIGGAAAVRADEALELTWSAPPACPGRDAIVAEVRRLLGGKLGTRDRRLVVDASVTVRDRDYDLRITTSGAEGKRSRTLSASTCDEVADAAALIVALAIDPDAVAATASSGTAGAGPAPTSSPGSIPTPQSSSAPSVSASPSVPPSASAAPQPPPAKTARPATSAREAPEAPSPWTLAAVAGAAGDVGTFRNATAAARAGFTAARDGLRVEATALFAWPGRVAVRDAPTKGGEPWLAAAALSVGGDGSPSARGAGLQALALAGSVGIEIGVQGASAFGVSDPGHGEAPWIAPFGAATLRWAIAGPLRLRLDAAMVLPLVRPEFFLTNVGSVQQPSPLTGRAAAGLEVDIAFFGTERRSPAHEALWRSP